MSAVAVADSAMPDTDAISPGVALAAARRSQNLSVEDVARQLRLSPSQVEAIEAGDYRHLPAPVFVRGFIRNYARLVRINPDVLLKDAQPVAAASMHQMTAHTAQSIPYPQGRKKRVPYFAIAALLVVAGLAWYEFYGTDDAKEPAASSSTTPPTKDVQPALVPAPEPNTITAPVVTPTPPPVQDSASSALPKSQGRLHFVFGRESWVEVRDGRGQIVLSQTNATGTQRTLEGIPPLSVTIGNAQAVRLDYNDKPVDLVPRTFNSVAKVTLE